MPELKECPFCGGKAQAFKDNYGKFGVVCNDCNTMIGVLLECGVELVDGWKAEFDTLDKAIEAWNRRPSAPCESCPEVKSEHEMYVRACEQIAAQKRLIEKLRRPSSWIPVEERFPENCGMPVLLCGINGYGQTNVFYGFTGYMGHGNLVFHSNTRTVNIDNYDITHWQPLPEPPEVDK